MCFWCHIKEITAKPKKTQSLFFFFFFVKFSHYVYLQWFYSLALTLGFLSILSLFCIWCEVGLQHHSFPWGCAVSPAPSGKTVLSFSLVESHLTTCLRVYTRALYSIPFVSMSVLMSVPTILISVTL